MPITRFRQCGFEFAMSLRARRQGVSNRDIAQTHGLRSQRVREIVRSEGAVIAATIRSTQRCAMSIRPGMTLRSNSRTCRQRFPKPESCCRIRDGWPWTHDCGKPRPFPGRCQEIVPSRTAGEGIAPTAPRSPQAGGLPGQYRPAHSPPATHTRVMTSPRRTSHSAVESHTGVPCCKCC